MQIKIYITYISLILIAVIITGALSISLLQANYINLLEDRLIANSKLIKQFLIIEDDFSKLNLDRLSKTYSKDINSRITFIDKDGRVIGDSGANIEDLENHKQRPEVMEALNGKIGINKRYSSSLMQELFYVAIPFNKPNSKLAVIRLSVTLSDIVYFNKVLLKYILISIVTGLMVALLLGFRFVKTFTEPIKELTLATKKISRGNYGDKVYAKTGDEVGLLAENFNIMSVKLEKTISEIEDRNSKTMAILTSMKNGVIALDNSKKVIFANPSVELMFNFKEEDIKGKYIQEFIKNNLLDDNVQRLINSNEEVKTEIELFIPKHKVINVYSNAIKLNQDINRKIGIVLIFEDITEIRKLENMRKDFVANVSHELKTPLTSIRGFIETLKSGAIEVENLRNKFLDIIDIEAERLSALIEDILVLSEIENKSNTVRKELINVNKSVCELYEIMNEIAKKKNIKLSKNIQDDLPNLYGNISWFKQMVINLIDNAIKYTLDGGKVYVNVFEKNDHIIIKVKDTGIGIDKDHLSRLFERFYRVEKARSRQVGGTGLGLAIVKHIAIVFNGKIDVYSKVNVGTEFTIKLPIKSKLGDNNEQQ